MSLRVMLSTVLMILTMTLSAGADGLQRLYVLDCGATSARPRQRSAPNARRLLLNCPTGRSCEKPAVSSRFTPWHTCPITLHSWNLR